ncbi:hypothetical protein V2S66_08190 [Streptomyces sp. V4-01]|uniref:Integral membrane protein n=1 Tax=Actinacidiphila polyblastidii TaxID=3110430 RepID=A0ABU7P818_9ACTN|nr:hypothetical protein [Streptomyces sp. V4-01]
MPVPAFPSAPGTSVPAGYVPPPAPAVPAVPSPAGQFVRRVLAGRWDRPALAALAPAALLVVLAGLLGATSGSLLSGSGIGFMTRSRTALALLLQGVGGSVSISAPLDEPDSLDSGDDGSDSFDDGSGSFEYGDGSGGFDDGGGSALMTSGHHTGHSSLGMVPLTVTLLWVLVLAVAVRAMRRRQTGPEAAVRVALLSAAATLVLALAARPSLQGVQVGSGPALAALGSLALAFATAFAVLAGPGRAAWLAARPQLVDALRLLRTTATALAVTVGVAAIVVFCVALAHYDDVTGWGLVLYAFILPNVGVSALNLGWGGPIDLSDRSGSSGMHTSYDLGDLSHVWSGWAAVGAVAGGAVCALLIGVVAARRGRTRGEQFAVAGLFTVLFVALAWLSGVTSVGGMLVTGLDSRASIGPSVSSALLFGLLWSFGGVFVAPYVARSLGVRGAEVYGPGAAYTPPGGGAPFGPQLVPGPGPVAPPSAGQTVHDLGVVQPPRMNQAPRGSAPPDHR